jgi:predicted RND superfamily exporter protein
MRHPPAIHLIPDAGFTACHRNRNQYLLGGILPLIIGIGIDSSIHLLHRLRGEKSKSVREAVTHTGKAILLTTLTTLLGFGSLAFINHPGMANLGVTVALGMTISLITTLVFIPAAYVLTMSKKEKTSFYHFESTDGQ